MAYGDGIGYLKGVLAASLFAALINIAHKHSFDYIGLDEILIFLYYGPIIVTTTYYLQSFELNAAVVIAGCAPGFFAIAIKTIDNINNLERDRDAKTLTLAVRFGKPFAVKKYFLSIVGASLVPIAIYFLTQDYLSSMLAAGTLLFAFRPIYSVMTKSDKLSLDAATVSTKWLLGIYSLLFSIGWNL